MERLTDFVALDRVLIRPAVLVPLSVLISLIVGAIPSFSVYSYLLVFGIGGILLWIGLSNAVPRHQPPRQLPSGTSWWIIPAGMLFVVESVTYLLGSGLLGSSDDFPTLSLLADPILERYLARSALFYGWLAAFWGLVRR